MKNNKREFVARPARAFSLAISLVMPATAMAVSTVDIGNGLSQPGGVYVNAQELTDTLVYTSVTVQATDSISIVDPVDMSSSSYGSPYYALILQAPVVNFDESMKIAKTATVGGVGGSIVESKEAVNFDAGTVNLNGSIVFPDNALAGSSRISGHATAVNVLSARASIQQGIFAADPTATATVSVSAGNYDGNVSLDNSSTTLSIADGVGVNGDVTLNAGRFDTSGGTVTVNGTTTNNVAVNVTGTTVHWDGAFINNGAYNSDPSTSYFTDLNVGAAGYLTGGAGDVFDVSGNFINDSLANTDWNTVAASLAFSGADGTSHTFDLTGLDLGAASAGFTDNFAWGDLNIGAGNSIALGGSGALYVGALEGLAFSGNDITNILGNGFNIYYDPTLDTSLGSRFYALGGGGYLCPVGVSDCSLSTLPTSNAPEPGTLPLITLAFGALMLDRRRRARMR